MWSLSLSHIWHRALFSFPFDSILPLDVLALASLWELILLSFPSLIQFTPILQSFLKGSLFNFTMSAIVPALVILNLRETPLELEKSQLEARKRGVWWQWLLFSQLPSSWCAYFWALTHAHRPGAATFLASLLRTKSSSRILKTMLHWYLWEIILQILILTWRLHEGTKPLSFCRSEDFIGCRGEHTHKSEGFQAHLGDSTVRFEVWVYAYCRFNTSIFKNMDDKKEKLCALLHRAFTH